MDDDQVDSLNEAKSLVPADKSFRICAECSGDCEPDPMAEDSHGLRIAWVCPKHGPHTLIDPSRSCADD